jgi:branched-chain amino acid transport system substrate-binding protein
MHRIFRTAAAACPALLSGAATPNGRFFPVLVFRAGPCARDGVPRANGFVDGLNLVDERDGGIGGVKVTFEECEFGCTSDRGVGCDERLKAKGRRHPKVRAVRSAGVPDERPGHAEAEA